MNSNTSSGDSVPAAAGEGRANQRRRTRRALIEAALALCEGGRKPSFPEVAERAMVSRATAYRYYSSVEDLISDAMFERAVPALESFCSPGQDDPAEMAARAARTMNKLLLDDEVGLHAVERSFMSAWLDNPQQSRPPRPARRMQYIGPIVDSLKGELTPAARRRLAHALATVMGTEAALSLRDVAGASVDEALAACGWAAQALVRQALAEARERSGKR
ncbi:TetR/AcrR family transcriptional regulator [Massilia solisilvae]|uniref:TetR/AcrR family transcriptional regulator n=1 Tax=Massilia solisilvae TaxID=1811225 RepID=A0ABT2BJ90_9BURK|nr:TetR/AcrR family transcriptional regulator [Massilia solisilvae]MCS0608577.1 TetR/AcrR family transcriptional regulator [Massilia solisilvae]